VAREAEALGSSAWGAAGSIITKDVAPYSIVGGNPAKLIKYRFEQAVIDRLLTFDFSKLSDEKILALHQTFYEPLTAENVNTVLARFE